MSVFFMNFMMQRMGGGVMGVGKKYGEDVYAEGNQVTFKDVAGQDEAKGILS